MPVVTSPALSLAYCVNFQLNRILGIKLGQVHPSEAGNETSFVFFFLLLIAWLFSHLFNLPHTCRCRIASGFPFTGKMHVSLPEMLVSATLDYNDLNFRSG